MVMMVKESNEMCMKIIVRTKTKRKQGSTQTHKHTNVHSSTLLGQGPNNFPPPPPLPPFPLVTKGYLCKKCLGKWAMPVKRGYRQCHSV